MAQVWSILAGSLPSGLSLSSSGLLSGQTSATGAYPLSLQCVTNGVTTDKADATVCTGYYAGVVGLWLFTEGTGYSVADSSGNYNVAMLMGASSWGSGSVTFTYGSGYMDVITKDTALNLTGSFSIMIHFMSTTPNGALVSKTSSGLNGYELSINSGGYAVFSIFSASGSTADPYFSITSTVAVSSSSHTIAALYDKGNKAYLYIDGVLNVTSSNNPSAAVVADASNFFVAARGPSGVPSDMLGLTVNFVAVYNRLLNAGEIAYAHSVFGS